MSIKINTDHLTPESICACDDCGKKFPISEARLIENIEQRIAAGEVVPVGQCPDCGALAHVVMEPNKNITCLPTTVHLVVAEHFNVPGIVTKIFFEKKSAINEAIDMVNIMLNDSSPETRSEIYGQVGTADADGANSDTWEKIMLLMQEIYGAANCYVEISEQMVRDAHQTNKFPTILGNAAGAISSLLEQISQMRGMFHDEDGAIQNAVDAGEEALSSIAALREKKGATA